MKTRYRRYLNLTTAAFLIAAPLAAGATASAPGAQKLDVRLARIAAAAAENRVEPLMSAGLTRELFRQNSPLAARWNAAGQVQVYLHYDRNGNPPDSAELAALGASDIVNSRALSVVQAWIPATKLADAATLAEVTRVSVPRYAFTRRSPPITASPRTGSVDTEGDTILGASQFRAATNYTGQGMVVGVISDGDSAVSTDQGTNDLPANVWNDPNNTTWQSSGAEGTAMMEIVYDLAPGVKQLGFAGPATQVDFLTALNDFAGGTSSPVINANVIVDDLGFPGEAMFTNGSFATGVQQFATAHPNIHLVTAAGNDATGFWAGSWNLIAVSGPSATINGVPYSKAMNFGTAGSPNIKLQIQDPQAGDIINYVVEWDDPWDDSSTTNDPNDYDVVLFDSSGNPIACNQGINIGPVAPATSGCAQTNNTSELNTPGPQPVQGSGATLASNETTAYLEIFFGSVTPNSPGTNLKILVFSGNSNQIQVTPNTPPGSIYAQSAVGFPEPSTATPGEITVGAVPASDTSSIESFSSQGPVEFGIPGSGTGTQPSEQIQKPDFVATDCVSVTGVGGFGSPFCGTSAAAPHIAGLIALLLSAYPGTDDPYTLLQDSATQPAGGASPNGIYGFGLPNMMNLLNAGTYPVTRAAISSPASGATIPGGQSATFESDCLGYDGTGVFSYKWDFGTGAIADSSSQNPSVTYSTAGTYTVTLTCTNKMGSGSTTGTYTVSAPRFSGGSGSLELPTLLYLLIMGGLAAMRRQTR
ncbi:MAG: PKD domain-containing protein [Gammaproteobacteria bacterium]